MNKYGLLLSRSSGETHHGVCVLLRIPVSQTAKGAMPHWDRNCRELETAADSLVGRPGSRLTPKALG